MNKKNALLIFSFLLFAVFSCENPTASPANNEVWSGWKDLSGSLEGLISDGSNIAGNKAINVLSYGVVDGRGRWVLAGADPYSRYSSSGTVYPVIFYSDDNGETWKEARFANPASRLGVDNFVVSITYDGPEGDKKFVLGTYFADVLWSYDGITWTMNSNVLSKPFPRAVSIRNVAYGGDVAVDGGSTGMYIANGGGEGEYAYASTPRDWKTAMSWKKVFMLDNMTINGKLVERPRSFQRGMNVSYGTGKIDGVPTGMFFAQWLAARPPGSGAEQEENLNLYSVDGLHWEVLVAKTVEQESLFTSYSGTYYYWQMPVDEERLEALDFQPTLTGQNVSVDTKGEALFAGDDLSSKTVRFAVVGGDYIMAVGQGRRLAIAHKGEYTVTAE
jgi:hypothetical protein